jgi:hypothetical protein
MFVLGRGAVAMAVVAFNELADAGEVDPLEAIGLPWKVGRARARRCGRGMLAGYVADSCVYVCRNRVCRSPVVRGD